MKKNLLVLMLVLCSLMLFAQNSYKELWSEVKRFETDNLPESANTLVAKIYKKAKKENNNPQLIKSLFHQSKYALILEEDATLSIINNFEKHIKKSNFPVKNVFQNILANLYWQYFQNKRHQFYNRTKTANKVAENDFRTWDLETLFEEIHKHYKASLKNPSGLQKIPVTDFSPILNLGDDITKYQPTLFDFLANNALLFYKTPEHNITKPAYEFKIDNPDYLCESSVFLEQNIITRDSLSLQFNALKVYQDLLTFHLKKDNKFALANIDIERLAFVKNFGVYDNANDRLLETYKTSSEKHKKHQVSGRYDYETAKIYQEKANAFNQSKLPEDRFKNKDALSICDKVIANFPESDGAISCRILKNEILQKVLNLVAEQYIPVQKHSRILVRYKNIDKLYFTAYKIEPESAEEFNKAYKIEEKQKLINTYNKVISWEGNLRNEEDYVQHTTEVVVPKFDNGIYLIVAGEILPFRQDKVFASAVIQVTNLSIANGLYNETNNYQVLHRNTGKPIYNAEVHLINKKTNRGNHINQKLKTDKNGFVTYKSNDYYNNVEIHLSANGENAIFGKHYLYKNHKKTNRIRTNQVIKPFLFTDRSIYRPGQKIYFKAILVKSNNEDSEVFTNQFVTVSLYDVNRQKVASRDLQLNEFGSVAGTFDLPNNGLTGNFQIKVENSTKNTTRHNFAYSVNSIAVEEYKRPKFAPEFQPITETYRINDKIEVNGFAKAFSGAHITDAKVVYRVHRKIQYPIWCYWRRPNINVSEQEIAYGETTTDQKGAFKIVFSALPDTSANRDNFPIFTYEVTADVTDVNGETRSATTLLKVGYHALITNISVDDKLYKKKETTVEISAENLNGEFVPTKGSLKIYKLNAPKHPLRPRVWPAPDYQDISEDEFRSLFPHEPYTSEENKFTNWEKGEVVFQENFDTEKNKEIALTNIEKWESGAYLIIAETKDKFGQYVKDEKRVLLFSSDDKMTADNALFSIHTNQTKYLPFENVELSVGSASKDITVMIQLEKAHKVLETQLVHLNNEIKTLRFPVLKEDVGGFVVKYYFVNYNHFQSGQIPIQVIEKEEKVEIVTNVFRDKLEPGQEETWSFSVKNDKNDQFSAEVLAAMYDASLDQFKPHTWSFNPTAKRGYYSHSSMNGRLSFGKASFRVENRLREARLSHPTIGKTQYNWSGLYLGFEHRRDRTMNMLFEAEPVAMRAKGVAKPMAAKSEMQAVEIIAEDSGLETKESNELAGEDGFETIQEDLGLIKARENFQETAFFFPQLQTNSKGEVSFTFTAPEALTRWKLQLIAHDKALQSASQKLTVVTQKELMVVPNAPRFLREGDKITLSAKISNLSEKALTGVSQLILTDPISGEDISSLLAERSRSQQKSFSVDKGGNTNVSWELEIPPALQSVQYKIVAKADDFTDGEQNVLPVLTNRMLVTETLPMWVKSGETRTFSLKKLKENTSSTLVNHKLTLEVTSNPVWYAVQALPYLMEYPYECAEQTFARFYANSMASHVANSSPKIQEVFEAWKSSEALLSNLEKNQELKSLLIQETPWLRDAQSELEQKKRIGLLFDLNRMTNNREKALRKLSDMQMSSGGFPWFKGGRYPNVFITQYIATGFGHLKKLSVSNLDTPTKNMLKKAVLFLDRELLEDYEALLHNAKKIRERAKTKEEGEKEYQKYLAKNNLSYFTIQYLYMRSFYNHLSLDKKTTEAVTYYRNQSAIYWNAYNLYAKGQIALSLFRNKQQEVAHKIIKSLKENSITSEELGMYWKENTAGYYYYQAPVETQALMIELFSEIENDTEVVDNLKIWLLKNKQTNRWKTTKATSEAVYALLLQGTNWVAIDDNVAVTLGDKKINVSTLKDVKKEAGTGYFKTSWKREELKAEMGEVTLSKKDKGIAWGGLYWQYFEDLDRITSAKTPLQLNKKLFLKVNTDKGKELQLVAPATKLKVGDLITVRIELRVDRAMEFVHMKDMRAAGVEPINVLSQYKWQDGIGYYESTKDAATNFFFDRLSKGIYVFEYDVRVNNAGNFSNGITTIQSMYAPEFSSHSKGERILVE